MKMILAVFFALCHGIASAAFVYPDNASFLRRGSHASIVLGRYLYVDGGELTYLVNGSTKAFAINSTLSIDLSVAWNNATAPIKQLGENSRPPMNWVTLWPNPDQSTAYTFGGEESYFLTNKVDPLLSQFSPDGAGGGTWSAESNSAILSALVQPTGGSRAYGNGTGYYLGGYLSGRTYPQVSGTYLTPVTGLVEFDTKTKQFKQVSASGFNNVGGITNGFAQFIPNLGENGMIIFFGGQGVSSSTVYSAVEPFLPMDQVALYEPASQKWYNQTATGDVPRPRVRGCVVGIQGNNGTYEIFMYAGGIGLGSDIPKASDAIEAARSYDEVFVLSLPAFTWFKANYTATLSRTLNTCHVVGNRQMLSFGGGAPTGFDVPDLIPDPFTQGIGIFDLTKMQWSDKYDPNAAPYKSPDVVTDYYNANGFGPKSWGSTELQSLFQKSNLTVTGSGKPPSGSSGSTGSTSNTGQKQQKSSSLSAGAIAGISVGVIVAIVAAAMGVGIYLFKRRRGAASQASGDSEVIEVRTEVAAKHMSEIDGFQRPNVFELPVAGGYEPPELSGNHQVAELPGDGKHDHGVQGRTEVE